MVEVNWSDSALDELEGLAEYIAMENAEAASNFVKRVFAAIDNLKLFPKSGHTPPELPDTEYREIYVTPCRLFYRLDKQDILIVHIMREEMQLRKYLLT